MRNPIRRTLRNGKTCARPEQAVSRTCLIQAVSIAPGSDRHAGQVIRRAAPRKAPTRQLALILPDACIIPASVSYTSFTPWARRRFATCWSGGGGQRHGYYVCPAARQRQGCKQRPVAVDLEPALARELEPTLGDQPSEWTMQQGLQRVTYDGATREVTVMHEIDFEARLVRVGGKTVRLTPKEFDLLHFLVTNPNKAVPHRKLLQTLWVPDYGDEVEYLRVFVNSLRKKIEPEPAKPRYLLTEPWVGYRFVLPQPPAE